MDPEIIHSQSKKMHRGRLGLIRDEYVMMRLRAHWISMGPGCVSAALVALLGVLVHLFLDVEPLAIAIYFFSLGTFMRTFLNWYYDLYHVTNRRIFHFRLTPGFRYDVDEVIFDLIKEVELVRPSFVASVLNYGHIFFGLGSDENSSVFTIRWIYKPQRLFQRINEALNQLMMSHD